MTGGGRQTLLAKRHFWVVLSHAHNMRALSMFMKEPHGYQLGQARKHDWYRKVRYTTLCSKQVLLDDHQGAATDLRNRKRASNIYTSAFLKSKAMSTWYYRWFSKHISSCFLFDQFSIDPGTGVQGRYWLVRPIGKLEANFDQWESSEPLSCRHTSVMQHAEIRFLIKISKVWILSIAGICCEPLSLSVLLFLLGAWLKRSPSKK